MIVLSRLECSHWQSACIRNLSGHPLTRKIGCHLGSRLEATAQPALSGIRETLHSTASLPPGSTTSKSSPSAPEAKAFGGQVIGSLALALRLRSDSRSSPVHTFQVRNPGPMPMAISRSSTPLSRARDQPSPPRLGVE